MLLRSPIQPLLSSVLARPKLPSVLQRALSILRRPGITANVYLPGIGTLSGLAAANYLLSDGSTGNTTVDGVTGLVLDAMGSETQLFNAVGVTTAGPSLTGLNASLNTTAGKTYKVTYTVTALVGQLSSVAGGTSGLAQAINWTGTYSEMLVAVTTGFTNCGLITRGIGVTSVTGSVTVTEVTGIHSTQPTTAAKPILRQTAGKYSWAFDGGDSLALGSVPFQMSDDFFVIAGANIPAIKADASTLFSSGDTVSGVGFYALDVSASGSLRGIFKDNAAVQDTPTYNTNVTGSAMVASIVKVGNNKSLRHNGVERASASTALGASTLNTALIGARTVVVTPSNYTVGSQCLLIVGKGTLTSSETLTLERLVANLTPNAPQF